MNKIKNKFLPSGPSHYDSDTTLLINKLGSSEKIIPLKPHPLKQFNIMTLPTARTRTNRRKKYTLILNMLVLLTVQILIRTTLKWI